MSAKRKTQRVHEWAWPKAQKRTVCGLVRGATPDEDRLTAIVEDLGEVTADQRCGNCERMRGAIGTSSRKGAKS